MDKSEEFIEDRIRWRGGQYKMPYPNTWFWECAPVSIKSNLVLNVGKPVLVSSSDEANFVVLCTLGFIVKREGVLSSARYGDIESIHYPQLRKDMVRSNVDTFELHMRNKRTQSVKLEGGDAYFSVISILSMLVKLS